ncbi:hypothetical protein BVI434_410054 [Burkholderia vietnamiensis]|nr:hypothetical protein BVI434_410054 [Burkholderia vietnamiensis]
MPREFKKRYLFSISSHAFLQKTMFVTSNTDAHLLAKKYIDNIFAHIHSM